MTDLKRKRQVKVLESRDCTYIGKQVLITLWYQYFITALGF